MNEELTIDEVMQLTQQALVERCDRTLALFPLLRAFYDSDFIEELTRRRNDKNYLLFLLAQPGDSIAMEIWTEVCGELDLLKDVGAIAGFRDKFRGRKEINFISARTELLFAARMHRAGKQVRFEPAVGNRRSEFVAERNGLAVHFEVKSVHDRQTIVKDDEVAEEIRRRLRVIEQPYILHLVDIDDISLVDCAKAVTLLKRQLRAHHAAQGPLPYLFACNGITVEASPSSSGRGCLGSSLGKGYVWQDENIRHARSRIHSSLGQLPPDGAGVVVIDRTPSVYVKHDDVFEACFGTSSLRVIGGKFVDYYDRSGVFHASSHTRISAVVSHSRRFLGTPETVVYHNPFAQKTLPDDFLAGDDVEQRRFDLLTGRMVTF